MRERDLTAGIAICALIATGPVLSRLAPDLLTPSRAFALAVAACFAAMALSLDVVAGHAGQLTLGHGAVVSLGAVASGVATAKWHLPFVAGAALGLAVGCLASWLFARPAVRLGTLSLGAVTLAVGMAVEASLFRWDWLTAGTDGMVLPRPLVGSFRFSEAGDYAALAVSIATVMWFADRAVERSQFGRGLHVVRDDPRLALALGIDPMRTKRRAFTLAGAMAGLAGATYGHLLITIGPDTFGFSRLSLPLLALVVIAGQGHALSVALVAGVYGLMPRILDPLEEWAPVISAALFLNAVARNPEGIASAVSAQRRRRRRTPPPEVSLDLTSVTSLIGRTESRALEIDDVVVEVGGRRLLDGLSLSVAPSTIVALVGPNGAGKTTALNAISGFIDVAGGAIRIGDVDLTRRSSHQRRSLGIARTFQGGSLPGRVDVEEALLLLQGGSRDDAGRLAASLGFADHLDVPVRELSVGQQRILEVAGSLSSGVGLLLLDEPSAGLSPPLVERLGDQLRAARDELGASVLLVEHNLPLVRAVADVVYVLDRGRVVHESPAADFFAARDREVLAWLGGPAS